MVILNISVIFKYKNTLSISEILQQYLFHFISFGGFIEPVFFSVGRGSVLPGVWLAIILTRAASHTLARERCVTVEYFKRSQTVTV